MQDKKLGSFAVCINVLLLLCAPSEDTDQPVHSWSVYTESTLGAFFKSHNSLFMQITKTDQNAQVLR